MTKQAKSGSSPLSSKEFNPRMTLYNVVFLSPKSQMLDVMDAFEDALSVSGFENLDSGDWYAELHYESEVEARAAADRAKENFCDSAVVAPLPDINWVEKSLEDLPAVEAGRFVIYGSHLAPSIAAGQIPLRIDAGQAFGTGHHGTTRGCLMALCDIVKRRRPLNALDLGCGTGVLAAGLVRLAPTRILASDIDPIAVEVAKEVARDNGVLPLMKFAVGPGFQSAEVKEAGPFDLIIANILARPLVTLAPQMRQFLQPGGAVVLSGLLIEQERRVLNAYLGQGFKFENRIHLDEWSTLVLRR